jgi:hypothetical protein
MEEHRPSDQASLGARARESFRHQLRWAVLALISFPIGRWLLGAAFPSDGSIRSIIGLSLVLAVVTENQPRLDIGATLAQASSLCSDHRLMTVPAASGDGVCALCGRSLSLRDAVWLAVARKSSEGAMVFASHSDCFARVAAPQFAQAITSPRPDPPRSTE